MPNGNGWTSEADVVVVGGGGSGLAATAGAAEAGARVVLLEKNPALGGTTALSIGSITATMTPFQKAKGIVDSPQEHYEDMELFAGDLAKRDNTALRRILVENVPETLNWLMSMGLTFFGPMPEPPHRKPRMHNVLPNSRAYVHFLARHCRRLGVEMRLNVRVDDLIEEAGRVVGVSATMNGRPERIRARRGVVLASGDYSGGRELKSQHVPELADIEAINPGSTGDGHVLGLKLGSSVINGEIVAGPHLRFVAPPTTSWIFRLPPARVLTRVMRFALDHAPERLLRPFILSFVTTFLAPEVTMFKEGAVLVNRRGERFVDELNAPANAVPKQPEREAFIVFDNAFAQKFSAWPYFVSTAPGVAYAYVPDYKRNRKDIFYQADSQDDLARAIGVPSEKLREAITAANGVAQDKGRPTLSEPPFYALGPVRSWVVLTDGGLSVTCEHQVTRSDGTVILQASMLPDRLGREVCC